MEYKYYKLMNINNHKKNEYHDSEETRKKTYEPKKDRIPWNKNKENVFMEHPIKCNKTYRYGDIFVKNKNIIFEFNGSYWHQNLEKDLVRKKEIEEQGYIVIFIDEVMLKKLQNMVSDLPQHILNATGGNKCGRI